MLETGFALAVITATFELYAITRLRPEQVHARY